VAGFRLRVKLRRTAIALATAVGRPGGPPEEAVKKPRLTAETVETAWFDRLTMSAHPELVEGCALCG